MKDNNLGCGKEFKRFICGIADAWGHEELCQDCRIKLKRKWNNEDMAFKTKNGFYPWERVTSIENNINSNELNKLQRRK